MKSCIKNVDILLTALKFLE